MHLSYYCKDNRFEICQPRRTNDVLTRVKVILYDSVLNILFVFISYDTQGLNAYISGRATTRARCGTHHVLNFRSLRPCFTTTITLSPHQGTTHRKVIVSPRDITWHEVRSLSTYASRGERADSQNPPLPFETLIPFFVEGFESFPLQGSKKSPTHSLSCGLHLSPFARESLLTALR